MASKVTKLGFMGLCMIIILALVAHMKPCNAATSLTEQCATAIQQVTSCLDFATGKAAQPTKQCCSAVTSMKDKQPVCLCFFIGQAHNGSQEIKSLGIQEAKLMQLPSACELQNASVANCPKLLGISPSSPAAAIFMNSNATSPTGSMAAPTTATPTGSGFQHGNGGLLAGILVVFVSALICGSPVTNLKSLF